MPPLVSARLALRVALCQSRWAMPLPMLALQHQVAVYKPPGHRPRLRTTDRVFWAWLDRRWPGWREARTCVQPRTVLVWQRTRWRDHWRRRSPSGKPGRPAIAPEGRALIRDRWRATPPWGAPRLVGELRTLGSDVAQSTGESYRVRPPTLPSPTGKACLTHPMQDMLALDCFTVPPVTYTVRFVLVILAHARRRVGHCPSTAHPTAPWPAPPGVAALPWAEAPRYLLRARDRRSGTVCRQRVWTMDLQAGMTAPRSPWQHPDVERLMGRIRRALLAPVMVRHERHLQHLLTCDVG